MQNSDIAEYFSSQMLEMQHNYSILLQQKKGTIKLLELQKLLPQLLLNSGRQKLVLEGVDKGLPSHSNTPSRILPPLTYISLQLGGCQGHPQTVILNAKHLECLHHLF